jgi:hypothetical protein
MAVREALSRLFLVSATEDAMKKEKAQIFSEKKSPRPYKDVKQLN